MEILIGWLLAAAGMTILYLIAERWREADIVDAGWAFLIGAVGLLYCILSDTGLERRFLVAVCIGAWSLRLSSYLFFGRVLHSGEDGRYAALRKSWGANASRNFFIFFQAQALFVVIFSLPIYIAVQNGTPELTPLDWMGVAVFAIAICGETIADGQLRAHRADPEERGKVCRRGLWRYSRHPNYFFEWLHWWCYPLFAWGAPWWAVTLVGPAFLLYLLLFVTGIPPTEARAIESRGEAYREYQRTTSAFVPLLPKS